MTISLAMALFRIEDQFPGYKDRFLDGKDIKGMAVYADDEEKVGSIHDILVNEAGRLCYFVIDTGFWVFGKKVLLPIGRCTEGPDSDRIYVNGLTKTQVEALPEYSDDQVIDRNYEAQVRQIYRGPAAERSAPVEGEVAVEGVGIKGYVTAPAPAQPAPSAPSRITVPPKEKRRQAVENPFDIEAVTTDDHDLYQMTDERHRRLRLYEERLVADKRRQKTGEVTVSKRVETTVVEGDIPVQKEKIVIEIESQPGTTSVNLPGDSVDVGSTAHTNLHSDQVALCKETIPHQEVTIRKVAEQDVVKVKGEVRREELEVNRQGNAEVEVVEPTSDRQV